MLDLTASLETGRAVRPRPLVLAAAAAAALALLAWMVSQLGAALLPLAAAAVAGAGLTYLSGVDLDLEERLAYGLVVGGMGLTVALLVLATLFGFGLVTVLVAMALDLAAGTAVALRGREQVRADLRGAAGRWLRDPRAAGHPWPLLLLLAVCWAYTVHLLGQVYLHLPTGLYAGYVNVWGDWGAHLAYAGSFAYGQNFPPEFPIDPGNRLGYPFMADLLAASLVPFGSSLPSALIEGSGYLALAFPAVMYLAGRRFLGGRLAPLLAVLVFLTSGGLGFLYWFQAFGRAGLAALQHIPREYTLDRDLNFQWLNPVLAYLLPQRSTLFGFSIALIVLALLFASRRSERWQTFLFAGVLAGLTPWFHVHAYGTIVALAAFWTLFGLRVQWLGFFVPALLLGIPALVWLWPPGSTPITWQFGWMAQSDGHQDSVLWFWFANLGLFIPLLLAAQFWGRARTGAYRAYFAPLWLWFLVPNFFLLAKWEWDNTKFFIFWAMFGAFLVAGLLAWLARLGGPGVLAAVAFFVLLAFSGVLDLTRATDLTQNTFQFTDQGGVKLAAWVRANTPARAVFLTSTNHNEPVPSLGGRRVVCGYPGWLWTYGITDFEEKQAAVNAMLQGSPRTPDLLARYHVSFVVIGPQEQAQPFDANLGYWREHGQVVYGDGEYTVFRVVPGA